MRSRTRVLCSAIVFLTLSLLILRNINIYRYFAWEGKQDCAYQFRDAQREAARFDGSTLTLAPGQGDGDSLFLSLDLHATPLGYLTEPSVELLEGETRYRQYFSRGIDGIRYLNIGHFRKKGKGNRIEMRFRGCRAGQGSAEIVRFRNSDLSRAKILVLAPHPDDAELAAFGLYKNKNAYIVTVTAGECAGEPTGVGADLLSEKALLLGKSRVFDSLAVPQLGGIPPERTLNLGFFDGSLEKLYRNPELTVPNQYWHADDLNVFRRLNTGRGWGLRDPAPKSSWVQLVADLKTVVETVAPDIIVTPDIYLDGNYDHRYMTVALLEALKKSAPKKDFCLYLYTNHLRYNDLYPYGPQDGLLSLPPMFAKGVRYSSARSILLSREDRADKLVAMEAQHALRPTLEETDDTVGWWLRRCMKATRRLMRYNVLGINDSYYKKFLRPNEVFLVIESRDLDRYRSDVRKYH